ADSEPPSPVPASAPTKAPPATAQTSPPSPAPTPPSTEPSEPATSAAAAPAPKLAPTGRLVLTADLPGASFKMAVGETLKPLSALEPNLLTPARFDIRADYIDRQPAMGAVERFAVRWNT